MSQNSVIKLKELLFEKESQEIGALTARLEQIAERAGSDVHFRRSVAATLEGALRDAEAANHRQVSDALAPLVVRTVRTEVETSSETLPARLYPHIGVMVRDYVRSAIRDLMEDINRRLEDGLTRNRLMLRLRSWTTGRSMAELALADSGRFEVDELHLIRRGSGELLAHWSRDGKTDDRADNGRDALFSGMLAAMTAFIEEVYEADKAGLRTIDFGAHTIYLRGSPLHLLAAKCRGEAAAGLQSLLDEEFLRTLQEDTAGRAGAATSDPVDLAALAARLEAGIAQRQEGLSRRRKGGGPLRVLLWLIALALASFIGWYGYISYRTSTLQAAVDRVIAETPALKGYPTRAQVARGAERIEISGLAPSGDVRTQVMERLHQVAPGVTISEAIGVVPGSESAVVASEVSQLREQMAAIQARLASLANAVDGLTASIAEAAKTQTIEARLQSLRGEIAEMARVGNVKAASVETQIQDLQGRIADLTRAESARTRSVETQLEEIRRQIAALTPAPDPRRELERWMSAHAVFFSDGTTVRDERQTDATLDALAALMHRTDTIVRIVGYTDERGTTDRNLPLALARADHVAEELTRRGIDRSRIRTVGRTAVLDISPRSGQSSPNRRVTFEPAFVGEEP